jgi:UDP-N-acetylmuramoylalanine--D-glutamate ligase
MKLTSIEQIKNAQVTVMGLGRHKKGSGLGAAKWLLRHGAQLLVTDLQSEEELAGSKVELLHWVEQYRADGREVHDPQFVFGKHREEDFVGVDMIVKNPGVPFSSSFIKIAEEKNILIESDVSLFLRFCPFPVIGITGTRGKSTSTAWMGEMLRSMHPKSVIAGNILHSPLEDLDWLLESEEQVPIVLELSSWLLESMQYLTTPLHIAVLTNLYTDHLDRHKTFEAYQEAKEIIFAHQNKDHFVIINHDQEICREVAERVGGRVLWFSTGALELEGAFVREGVLMLKLDGKEVELCKTDELGLKGEHNSANALVAALGAYLAGVEVQDIITSLKSFTGLDGRQQQIREVDGVRYINDTTATSPEGVIAALKRFSSEGDIVLIAGGNAKGFTFEEMGEWIQKKCKHVVLFEGTGTALMEASMGSELTIEHADSMQKAVKLAQSASSKGDIILMAPGGSSFAMFKNEFDRGDQFNEVVKSL